jgi:hypothetical protein
MSRLLSSLLIQRSLLVCASSLIMEAPLAVFATDFFHRVNARRAAPSTIVALAVLLTLVRRHAIAFC